MQCIKYDYVVILAWQQAVLVGLNTTIFCWKSIVTECSACTITYMMTVIVKRSSYY